MAQFPGSRAVSAGFIAASIILSGCASGGLSASGQPRTALERSVGTCLVSVGAGVLVDMLTNHRRIGAGTAVGAGLCAVVLAVNNEADKQRIQQSQQAALNAGKDRTDQYVGDDGNARIIRTSVHPSDAPSDLNARLAPDGSKFVGPCRKAQTEISVQGKGSASLDPETVCRTAQGNWQPWPGAVSA